MRDHITSIFLCIFQVAAGLSLTAALSRTLEITDYGFYVTFVSAILILAVISQFGVPDIIMRETARRRKMRPDSLRALWRGGDILVFPTVVICAITGVVALRASKGDLPDTGLLVSMVMHIPLMTLLGLRAGALKGLGLPNVAHALMSILPPLTSIVAILGAQIAQIPVSLNLAVLANATGLTLSLIISHIFRQHMVMEDDGRWANAIERRIMRRESLPVAGIAGLGIFSSQVDVLMLGMISGAAAAGIYQVALSCAMLINILKPRVGMIAAHRIPELWAAGNTAEIEKITRPVALIVSCAALTLLIASTLSGGPILAAVFGEAYRASAPVLVMISLSLLIAGVTGIVGYILLMTGNQKTILRSSVISALINLLLNPPLIYLAGPFGAAIAYMISMTYWSVSLWLQVRKLGIDPSAMGWARAHFSQPIAA